MSELVDILTNRLRHEIGITVDTHSFEDMGRACAKAALAVVAEWLDAEDPMYVFAAQSIRQQIKEPPHA